MGFNRVLARSHCAGIRRAVPGRLGEQLSAANTVVAGYPSAQQLAVFSCKTQERATLRHCPGEWVGPAQKRPVPLVRSESKHHADCPLIDVGIAGTPSVANVVIALVLDAPPHIAGEVIPQSETDGPVGAVVTRSP